MNQCFEIISPLRPSRLPGVALAESGPLREAICLSNIRIKNLEKTKTNPSYLTVSCILHGLRMSRNTNSNKSFNRNDICKNQSLTSRRQSKNNSRLMGGPFSTKMSCLNNDLKIYNWFRGRRTVAGANRRRFPELAPGTVVAAPLAT
jgi:hypothetical protein